MYSSGVYISLGRYLTQRVKTIKSGNTVLKVYNDKRIAKSPVSCGSRTFRDLLTHEGGRA
jgi:hypothetical protein